MMRTSSSLKSMVEEVAALETKLAALERLYSQPLRPISELGEAVREARTRQKLSQRALAELSGVGQATVVGLETGKRSPNQESVQKVLSTLGLALYVGGVS